MQKTFKVGTKVRLVRVDAYDVGHRKLSVGQTGTVIHSNLLTGEGFVEVQMDGPAPFPYNFTLDQVEEE